MSIDIQVHSGPQLACAGCVGAISVEEIPLCGACADPHINGVRRPQVPAKTLSDWSAVVDSYYAARDAYGHVQQPNWAVMWLRIHPYTSAVVDSECIDVCPALPSEIPAGANPSTTRGAKAPIDSAALSARLGYPSKGIVFVLDHTGIHTARFIAEQRRNRGIV
ncbi:hypothetical protein [Mycobacteroides abscessus]|uniref:hypothetical protein n=1 Tax=Mycobacteroides abscessus TaxID=36809 RepID=UPI00266B9E91|nr:hypothetical protein [Mycobacteroides abscessus]MDO3331396.1 hypothetical protein [Mycobacteroides abscessus subsp. abscessus]